MGELSAIGIAEIARHKAASDCWLVIHGKVYDVTNFLPDHPGGEDVVLAVAGKDATADFEDVGHSESARHQMDQFLVGVLDNYEPGKPAPSAPSISSSLQHQPQQPQQHRQGEANFFLKYGIPLLILGLAFVLRFFAKKDVEKS